MPPAGTFGMGFSITASEEYSDNFRLSSNDREDNFRSVLSPGARLDINGAFTKGALAYTLSATHDSSRNDDVNFFHSFNGHVAWEASPRLRFTVADTFTRSDEPSQANRLNLRRDRRPFTSNAFSLSSDYLLGRVATTTYYRLFNFWAEQDTTTHTAGLTASTTFYETNTASVGYEYLNSNTDGQGNADDLFTQTGSSSTNGHRFQGSLQRQLTELMSAGITGSYATRSSDTSSDDYDLWTVSLFSGYGTPRLSLVSSIGYTQVLRDAGGTDSSISTTSSLVYRFARAVASLGVDSGFSETFADGENFGVVETRGVTGSLFYPFTPSISGTVSGFYRENETTGLSSGGNNDEKTWGAALNISIRLTRWLGLLLDYAYTEVSSSSRTAGTDQGGYTENRARVSLNASF